MQSPLRNALFLLRYRLSEIYVRVSQIPSQFDLGHRKRDFYSSPFVRNHLQKMGDGQEIGRDEISVSLRQAALQLQIKIENEQADPQRPVACSIALGERYRWTVRQCLKSHRDYVSLHGYAHVELTEPPSVMPRAASWYKIPLLYALLEKGHQNVFHLDADALVTNKTVRLEDFFEKLRTAGKSWLLARDDFGFNVGVSFARNTPDMLRLLDLIWSYDLNLRHLHWEQHAVSELVKNCRDLQKLILVPDGPATFNKYPPEFPTPGLPRRLNDWNEGDFICHFAGIRRRDLEEIAALYAAKAHAGA